jgi:hypothetical protein
MLIEAALRQQAARDEAEHDGRNRPGYRVPNQPRQQEAAIMPTKPITTMMPQTRRLANVSVALFQRRSARAISAPIHITGWPMRRTSARG